MFGAIVEPSEHVAPVGTVSLRNNILRPVFIEVQKYNPCIPRFGWRRRRVTDSPAGLVID